MKATKILAALLASAAVLSSCSKEKSLSGDNTVGEPVSISIKLTRATRANPSVNPQDEDAVINDLIVFVTRADGTFDVSPIFIDNPASTTLDPILATTLATDVYIICNTGDKDTGPLASVGNLAQLARAAAALDGNGNTLSNCKSKNVWMSGSAGSLTANGTAPDGKPQKTATVKLYYLPAKIYVKVVNNMSNYSQTGNTLLDGIAVVNGGAWTGFIPDYEGYRPRRTDIPANTPFYYNGLTLDPAHYRDQPVFNTQPDYVTKAIYNYTNTVFQTNFTAPYTVQMQDTEGFYVFPGITSHLTYVTVYGRYAESGNITFADPNHFFSAAFGGQDGLLSAIESGKKYLVTITLNGDANAGAGGTDDPTEEIVDAYVDITITPAEWSVEIKDKVIN